MPIDQLSSSQLEFFALHASVTHTFMGARKFEAEVTIDGKKEMVIAAAKEVYASLEKERGAYGDPKYREIVHKFRSVEIITRDSSVFAKQLNFIQKIYYYIVKFFFGMDYSDTWVDKFPMLDKYLNNKMIGSEIDKYNNNSKFSHVADAGHDMIEASQKIKPALSVFNGLAYDKVIVNTMGRGTPLQGTGLLEFESSCYTQRKYFMEHIFYNPRALIITVVSYLEEDSRILDTRDNTIPEDVTCGVYYMCEDEYNALPKVSQKLTDFMKNRQSICENASCIYTQINSK
jgi:hypothetical protein